MKNHHINTSESRKIISSIINFLAMKKEFINNFDPVVVLKLRIFVFYYYEK